MKRKKTSIIIIVLLFLFFNNSQVDASHSFVPRSYATSKTVATTGTIGSSFTYQGRLTYQGKPANGFFDFEFKLFNDRILGIQVGSTIERDDIDVVNGLFYADLDFGDVFDGTKLWLEIGVRTGDSTGAYTTLTPRQALSPAPFSIYASTVPWNGIKGVPSGFADNIDNDTHLSEEQVENFVTNGPLDLYPGTTLNGSAFSTFVSGDCDEIQNAINALPVSGGQILLKRGDYTCAQPILIDRDNVDLRGQGASTILHLADGANSPVLIIGQTNSSPAITRSNIHVSDLVIDGNRVNQLYECWGGLCDQGGYTYIRNNGITLRRVDNVTIERVIAYSAISGGLVSEKGSQRITILDFTSYDNHFDGLAAYETENSVFSDLHLYDNLSAGLSFDWNFNNNIVGNAVITNNGTVGIFIINARDNLFHDLQILNSTQHGIFIAESAGPTTAATGNTFSNIVISDSGQQADPTIEGFCVDSFVGGVGVCVNNTSAINNLVVGAQFINNSADCIKEASPGLLQTFGVVCR